jgi:rubrerythrin
VDIIAVLRKLGELEKVVASAYEWAATRFPEDEKARDFFKKLAEEEEQRLELIKYQERVVRKSPKEFSGVDFDMPSVQNTLAKIDAFCKSEPTVRDSIRFALDIETDVGEKYGASIMRQSNPQFAESVKGLAVNASQGHYVQLIEFARDYSE